MRNRSSANQQKQQKIRSSVCLNNLSYIFINLQKYKMSFIFFQLLVTLAVVHAVSSFAVNSQNKKASLEMKDFMKKFGSVEEEEVSSSTPSLRVEAAGNDYKWLEWIDYNDGTCKPNEAWHATALPLHTCIEWTEEEDADTQFARIDCEPIAASNYHKLKVTFRYFKDSQCTMQSWKKHSMKVPNDRCYAPEEEEGAGRIYRTIKEFPANMVPGNAGYAVATYGSAQQCMNNMPQNAKMVNYEAFNFCSNDDQTGMDSWIVGCDNGAIHGVSYTSQDNSCTGTPTVFNVQRGSDTCHMENGIVPSFWNYICM
jgi:hypothetical protein